MSFSDPGDEHQAVLQITGSFRPSGKPTWNYNQPSYSRLADASGRPRLFDLGNKSDQCSIFPSLVVGIQYGLAWASEGHVQVTICHMHTYSHKSCFQPQGSAAISFPLHCPQASSFPLLYSCSLSLSLVIIFMKFHWHKNITEL